VAGRVSWCGYQARVRLGGLASPEGVAAAMAAEEEEIKHGSSIRSRMRCLRGSRGAVRVERARGRLYIAG
jgi:hypothetical protein